MQLVYSMKSFNFLLMLWLLHLCLDEMENYENFALEMKRACARYSGTGTKRRNKLNFPLVRCGAGHKERWKNFVQHRRRRRLVDKVRIETNEAIAVDG